ncbi:hypothetical protein [Lentzea tibetensis]|nr:hypothetical protein [Lentzea tibetensis]
MDAAHRSLDFFPEHPVDEVSDSDDDMHWMVQELLDAGVLSRVGGG